MKFQNAARTSLGPHAILDDLPDGRDFVRLVPLLRELFGLTRTEAEIAVQIASGERAVSVARIRCIAPSTVRTHLNRIFAKTGTSHQGALVMVVMRTVDANGRAPRSAVEMPDAACRRDYLPQVSCLAGHPGRARRTSAAATNAA